MGLCIVAVTAMGGAAVFQTEPGAGNGSVDREATKALSPEVCVAGSDEPLPAFGEQVLGTESRVVLCPSASRDTPKPA